MRKAVLFAAIIVILLLMSGIAGAHPRAPQELTPVANPAPVKVLAPTSPTKNQPGEAGESEFQHNIVKYLGYSLFVLIVLSVGSGFFKKKKVYRTIHHAFAFTLLGVAIIHGILAITL